MRTVITTPEYAELLGITPALAPKQVCAIVADDAPLDYESFTLGSEYRYDMNKMHDKLDALGVRNELVDPYAERGEEKPHCFIANERNDATAKNAFDRVLAFLKSNT